MNWKELECTGIRCNHETLENHYIVFDRDIKHSQQQLLESLELESQERLDGLMEKLADIEHERWAKWQQYMHSKLQKNPYQGFPYLLDEEWVERWSKQIGTDYEYLSEKEKESDREQVRPYLSLIKGEVKALIQSKKEL